MIKEIKGCENSFQLVPGQVLLQAFRQAAVRSKQMPLSHLQNFWIPEETARVSKYITDHLYV